MKKIIIINSLLAVFACTEKRKTHFEGYVYHNNRPLKNVIVSENIKVTKLNSITNDSGYFKLKRYSLTSAFYLIFKKEGFITDTINLVGSGNPGQMPETLFLRERKDTLFMKPLNNSKSKE